MRRFLALSFRREMWGLKKMRHPMRHERDISPAHHGCSNRKPMTSLVHRLWIGKDAGAPVVVVVSRRRGAARWGWWLKKSSSGSYGSEVEKRLWETEQSAIVWVGANGCGDEEKKRYSKMRPMIYKRLTAAQWDEKALVAIWSYQQEENIREGATGDASHSMEKLG